MMFQREWRGEFVRVGFKVKRSCEVGGAGAPLIVVSRTVCRHRSWQIVKSSTVARHSGFKHFSVSRTP